MHASARRLSRGCNCKGGFTRSPDGVAAGRPPVQPTSELRRGCGKHILETDARPEQGPVGATLLDGDRIGRDAIDGDALGGQALDAGTHDLAAERGESGLGMQASLPAPAIVRLRPALAPLLLAPVEHDLDPGGAGEPPREVVEERGVPARDDDEEPAPLAHEDNLNEL